MTAPPPCEPTMPDLTAERLCDEAMAGANALLAVEHPELALPDGMDDAFELGVWLGLAATLEVLMQHRLLADR